MTAENIFQELTIPDFQPKTTLDEYLISAENIDLYHILRYCDISQMEKLEYFNKLYFLYELIIRNLDKPSSVVQYLRMQNSGDPALFLYNLLEDLTSILKKSPEFINDVFDTKLYIILDLIQDEICILGETVDPDTYGDGVEREFYRIISLRNIKRQLKNEIPRLKRILSNYLHNANTTKDEPSQKLVNRLSLHIKYLESLLPQNDNVNERIPALTENTDKSDKSEQTEVYIFPKVLLNKFYFAFNGYLWENVEPSEFLGWFKLSPIGKPVFIEEMMTYFCYAIGKIKDKLIPESRPVNFGDWMQHHIGGSNYSSLKKRATIKVKTAFIDEKVASF